MDSERVKATRIRRGLSGMVAMLAMLLSAAPADAQRVRLEIRPQVGDTIHMQLDQEIEVSGTSPEAAAGAPRAMTGSAHWIRGRITRNLPSSVV